MKTFLFNLLFVGVAFAGTYENYVYDGLDNTEIGSKEIFDKLSIPTLDPFTHGDFEEIIRFNKLDFSDGYLDDESSEYFEELLKTVNRYLDNERNILLTVIGHSDKRTDINNEIKVDSDTYANAIQNVFRYSLSKEEAFENSTDYASNITQLLEDNNVSKEIITKEYRSGKDMGYSDGTDDGRELNNRVMVTMYVLALKDSDKDGVVDSKDRCPDTPLDIKVDENGCCLDSDKDGVVDHKDECPDTPLEVNVNEQGCPLDSDEDGVFDYLDKCPDTMKGLKVDEVGCPLSMTLKLNFKTDSYEIEDSARQKVLDFANFMIENPPYFADIIGHTDSVAPEDYNLKLSINRANATMELLVDYGVEEGRLKVQGQGELEPIESNDTDLGRAANRRIEVKLSK